VSLSRKQQSLLEALQAVDNVAAQFEEYKQRHLERQDVIERNKTQRIKSKLKEWNQRRKSIGIHRKMSNSFNVKHNQSDSAFINIPDINDNDNNHDLNAKEMQILSQKLSFDVANKTQSIQNLEIANTVLLGQMQKMKMEMDEMEKEKNKYDQNKYGNNNDVQ